MRRLSTTTWLLLLVIGLGGGYFLLKTCLKSSRSKDYPELLVDFDRASLKTLSLQKGAKEVLLTRKDSTWYVQLGNGKNVTASASRVEEAIELLFNIKPSRIYSKSDSLWNSIELDTTGTRIEASVGPKKVLDLVVGKTEFTSDRSYHTYVRLYNETTSYVASDVFSYSLRAEPNAYRETSLLSVDVDSVEKIRFQDHANKTSFSLQKKDSLWLLSDIPSPPDAQKAIQDYLESISNLSSELFDDDFTPAALPTRSLQIIDKQGGKQGVKLYQQNATNWYIQSDKNPENVFLDNEVAKKISSLIKVFQ